MTTQSNEAYGQHSYDTNLDPNIAMRFMVQQLLNCMQTVALVKVVGVSQHGDLSPVGTVNVQPLVNQMTGDRKAVPHGVIYGIPYFRLQGGSNALILDPQVGDIGMCGFCSRDSASAVANKGFANPNSHRKFDWADGLYFGGFLNGTPQQYVRFSADGLEVVSPSKVTIQAPNVELKGQITLTGEVSASASIQAKKDVKAGLISLKEHTHAGVQSGQSNTGVPQ